MSRRDAVLQRLEAAMANLEAVAEQRLAMPAPEAAPEVVTVQEVVTVKEVVADPALQEQLVALTEERDGLAKQVAEQSKKNAALGNRLDKAIAKLNKVLEQA